MRNMATQTLFLFKTQELKCFERDSGRTKQRGRGRCSNSSVILHSRSTIERETVNLQFFGVNAMTKEQALKIDPEVFGLWNHWEQLKEGLLIQKCYMPGKDGCLELIALPQVNKRGVLEKLREPKVAGGQCAPPDSRWMSTSLLVAFDEKRF